MVLDSGMRRALEREEFVLHYQPLVETGSRKTIGVEALVRWAKPENGLVPPSQFIPLAEETGLIVPLGAWVLEQSCRQFTTWLNQKLAIDILAVNLSPVQFRHPDVVRMIGEVLAHSGMPPAQLELEITEGALMDGAETEAKLRALKELGVRLSIDDFGTGFSSLAYLKRFPIDKLKVDQSFVRDIPGARADMEIVAAVISLAKNLRLDVLAEGVETEAQLEGRDRGPARGAAGDGVRLCPGLSVQPPDAARRALSAVARTELTGHPRTIMPELPEVETVRLGLEIAMAGRLLSRVAQRRPDLRRPFPPLFAERLTGRRIERLSRRAKYLVLHLDDGARRAGSSRHVGPPAGRGARTARRRAPMIHVIFDLR